MTGRGVLRVDTQFNYNVLDSLFFVPAAELSGTLNGVSLTPDSGIGQLIEFCYVVRQAEYAHLDAVRSRVQDPRLRAVVDAVGGRDGELRTTSLKASQHEVARLPPSHASNPYWKAMYRRLGDAASKAGFRDSVSKGLVAAFLELADNAAEHSGAAHTTVAAYRWQPGEFEMVVADAGVGVRRSLARNPAYRTIPDDGTAIALAVAEGVSGVVTPGRGLGFRSIYQSIAGMSGRLRFHSGSAALVIEGQRLDRIQQTVQQSGRYHGFFAAITCRP